MGLSVFRDRVRLATLLRGERVQLDALTKDDLPVMARWQQNTLFLRLFDARPARPQPVENLTRDWEEQSKSKEGFVFAIRLLDGGRLIGVVELDGILWAHQCGWLGIGIGEPEYWGKGYGREAMGLLLQFAFDELNLHRVGLTVYDYNKRAIALYEKLGFRREGTFREFMQRDGKRCDMYLYGLLRREWNESKRRMAPARVLVLSQSDRWHRCEEYSALVGRWAEALEGVQVEHSHDKAVLAGDGLVEYDVCVLMASMSDLADEQEGGLVRWVAEGGHLLAIHSAAVADEGRAGYVDLLGGRFVRHPPYGEFPVQVWDSGHPVTSGLTSFAIADELYILDRTPAGVCILATAVWDGQAHPLVYVKEHGQGRVLYNALGHDQAAFDHPAFQKLFVQGLKWACAS